MLFSHHLVEVLTDRAAPQIDIALGETKHGGIIQYQFYKFDLKWIKETRALDCPVETP